MQNQQSLFDFTAKESTPDLNLNHLDYTMLSGYAEFSDKLLKFNEQYNMSLVATKSSRWQPGTYNKIKANIDNVLYPHWKKRRGANSISKLLETNNWRYQNFKDELDRLDTMLYSYRKSGIELYSDDDLDEAKVLLSELLDKFTNKIDDIEVCIEPIPHFGRHLRGYKGTYDDYNTGKSARLYPIINQENEIVGSYNDSTYYDYQSYLNISKSERPNTNPGEWFVNIRIALRDININVTNSDMTRTYGELPYGDLIICFTIDLITLVTNYRRAIDKKHMINTEYIGVATTKFPKYSALEHPFVYTNRRSDYENINFLRHFNSYGNGNTCLGELTNDINHALILGNLELLKSYLNIWARSFSAGVTSPLNELSKCHFGVPKEWDEGTRAIIPANASTCNIQIKKDEYSTQEKKQEFCEEFCSNCSIANQCKVYARLTIDNICWIDECDNELVQAYNVLTYHLKDEVDEKKVYEMFADLYCYMQSSDTWNVDNIRRVFTYMRSLHSADFIDNTEYVKKIVEDGINRNNIIELFERFHREWTLYSIKTDNPEMWESIIAKVGKVSFDEAIRILTTREIEDNYYSWLFATRGVNRDNYHTYIKMLNSRKEGMRYGD